MVGYGHASVAEHAVLHLALENVSRLAIETIEGNRLASYTEKSTRYQKWDGDAFYVPEELKGKDLSDEFIKLCKSLFQTYEKSIPKVQEFLQNKYPQNEGESEKAYLRRIQPAAVDICRFLLPAASLANVGMTINARAFEYAICKMLSSPLQEVQAIGERLCEVGQIETPTLIKYAACNQYLVSTREEMQHYNRQIAIGNGSSDFRLITWDEDGQDQILAAILFRFGQVQDHQSCLAHVASLSIAQKKGLVKTIMDQRGRFDQPLREFEYAQMTFEVVMDQGAYFEFKRHRMMTQTVQPLSPHLGFAVPRGVTESGWEDDYATVMRQAAALYQKIAEKDVDVASYIIPNGFNRRVLFTMNLRQAFHFCRLRAAPNAHFSIRRIAQLMAVTIRQIYPLLGHYLDVPEDDTFEQIEQQHFSALEMK